MDELFAIKDVYKLYESHQLLALLFVMIMVFYPVFLIIKKLIVPGIDKIANKKSKNYSKIFAKHKLSNHLIWVFTALYLMVWGDIFDKSNLINSAIIGIKDIAVHVYVVVTMTSLLLTLMEIIVDIYQLNENSKRIAIGLHMHIIKIIVITCAILTIFSLVLGVSIGSLFTSLGAAAALLTFVFKDTVLGLMASLQLTFQNIIQVGDWVTLPKYNADGDIQKITITVVVIKNFDQTYTTVPTSAFLTTGVKNWRPMFEIGGRRIKRAINIDMDTIKISNKASLDKFKKMPCMVNFAKENAQLFDVKSLRTNISMFRCYINEYLRSNQEIHQEGFTFLIRELDPTPFGLPIELYVFTKDTNWINYEAIQADIFDHLIGIMPQFELKPFQTLLKK